VYIDRSVVILQHLGGLGAWLRSIADLTEPLFAGGPGQNQGAGGRARQDHHGLRLSDWREKKHRKERLTMKHVLYRLYTLMYYFSTNADCILPCTTTVLMQIV